MPTAVSKYDPIDKVLKNNINWKNYILPEGNYTAEHIVGEIYNSNNRRYEYIETDSMIDNSGSNIYVISVTGLYSNRQNIRNGGFMDYD